MQIQEVKFILYAADMERAVTFWRDVVGLTERMQSPYWSELLHGDAVVALHGGGDGMFRQTGLGLQVGDLAAACDEVVAGGGSIRMPPRALPGQPVEIAELTDPEGNGFALSQWIGSR